MTLKVTGIWKGNFGEGPKFPGQLEKYLSWLFTPVWEATHATPKAQEAATGLKTHQEISGSSWEIG